MSAALLLKSRHLDLARHQLQETIEDLVITVAE
jgi:hypothetical protein